MKILQLISLTILIMFVTKVNTQFRDTSFIKSVFEKTSKSITSYHTTRRSDINLKYQCAVACSSDDLCTRLEFCPNSLSDKCSLYQSGSTCYEVNDEKTQAGCECFRLELMKYEDETCRCPVGVYGDGDQCCEHVLKDCTEGAALDKLVGREDVISFIKPLSYSGEPFEVVCSFKWGGLTVIHKRLQRNDAICFNKNWIEYSDGFGTLHANFWLGLDKMYHILQNNSPNGFDLHIHFLNESNAHCMWHVDAFNLEDESSNYTATFQDATMSIGDYCDRMFTSLTPDSRQFSTYDHVSYPNNFNCTGREEAGWWFADDVDCSFSNLNSERVDDDILVKTATGILKLNKAYMQLKRII